MGKAAAEGGEGEDTPERERQCREGGGEGGGVCTGSAVGAEALYAVVRAATVRAWSKSNETLRLCPRLRRFGFGSTALDCVCIPNNNSNENAKEGKGVRSRVCVDQHPIKGGSLRGPPQCLRRPPIYFLFSKILFFFFSFFF